MQFPSQLSRFIRNGEILQILDKCGVLLCRQGTIEVSLEDETYQIKRGDFYICFPSTLAHLLHKSDDAEGIMIEIELDYIIPILSKVINIENQLFIRQHPCVSLSEEQYTHLNTMLENLHKRIIAENIPEMPSLRRHLMTELIKSMAQTICYEVLNIYFANQPLQPLKQDKKDIIFQNFMLSLYRYYRKERDVAFYARQQHITPRYFSAIIKEKSGSSASQWIIKIVTTEAKQLLEGSDLSIKEIASRLNFPTQSFFGKYFKQYVGISPKAYRQSRMLS